MIKLKLITKKVWLISWVLKVMIWICKIKETCLVFKDKKLNLLKVVKFRIIEIIKIKALLILWIKIKTILILNRKYQLQALIKKEIRKISLINKTYKGYTVIFKMILRFKVIIRLKWIKYWNYKMIKILLEILNLK